MASRFIAPLNYKYERVRAISKKNLHFDRIKNKPTFQASIKPSYTQGTYTPHNNLIDTNANSNTYHLYRLGHTDPDTVGRRLAEHRERARQGRARDEREG